MKNIIKTGLVVVIAFTPLVNIAQAAFPDVPEDHIYSDAINYVQEEGIVSGFSDGTYRPENSITRAEFTKIITNSMYDWVEAGDISENIEPKIGDADFAFPYDFCEYGDVGGVYSYGHFSDVETHSIRYIFEEGEFLHDDDRPIIGEAEEGNKFSKYICVAKKKGLISGYADGTFKPDNLITVGEASKIISNAYEFTNVQSGPEGDVFKPFVDALAERNVIPATIISIDSELKRGEMAEIIYRLEDNVMNKRSLEYSDLVGNIPSEEIISSGIAGASVHYYYYQGLGMKQCVGNIIGYNTQSACDALGSSQTENGLINQVGLTCDMDPEGCIMGDKLMVTATDRCSSDARSVKVTYKNKSLVLRIVDRTPGNGGFDLGLDPYIDLGIYNDFQIGVTGSQDISYECLE